MKAYWTVVRNMIMSSLTYRAHILFQSMASVFAIAVVWFLWSSVFAATGSETLRGLTFKQTFLYVSLAAAIAVLMKTWSDWEMHFQIRSGDIVVHFFRPYDHMVYAFFSSFGIMLGNMITVTIPSLIAIFLIFQMPVPGLLNVLLFVPALFQAYCLSFLFDYMVGVTCFRTESIWGISITKEVLILFLSGAMIPLPFFPEPARSVLSVLPFASMYNTPLSLLAGSVSWETALSRLGLQTVWIGAMFVIVRLYYNRTIRKLIVNGG